MKKRNSQWHSNYDFIYEIPPLILSYPHGVFTDSFKPDVSSYELHFKDVCSFLEHVCLCRAGGSQIAYHPDKKAVHIIYRKHLLIGNELMDRLWQVELALDKEPNSVSETDKKLYRDTMVSIVKDVLLDRKSCLFEVNKISYPL